MTSHFTETYTLSNGVHMPVLGLGTYRVRDQEILDACLLEALRTGYRLIDTATVYRNERAIGNSLKRIFEQDLVPGLRREDIFLTSKLAPKDQGYDACYQAVQDSLQNLQVDYIDLYLIHWPGTARLKLPDPRNAINRMESWRALEDLYREKKLRAIGVSNYTLGHLKQLVQRPHMVHPHPSHHHPHQQQDPLPPGSVASIQAPTEHRALASTLVIPHVHQFELHPRLVQKDILDFCAVHKIQVQAYSSLGEGRLISLDALPPQKSKRESPSSSPSPPPVAPLGALEIMPYLIQKYFPSVNMSFERQEEDGVGTDAVTAATYARYSAKILLRWGLQHGFVVIPKSTQPERIRDNFDVFEFELEQEDMQQLDLYSLGNQRTRYCWDPTNVH
ncbi:hypothetical protein EMPS_06579 [Entomortierella parvispora]|uniref:NADP-dependent oxidoreductase domain-containing protein n=1 Tax=Entomortierella parvispora TaxID=205924 RepID=A0A9P3HCT7_9FUNG|nr:hypothetical protein EMPS_06579 [Entomortierella parvispora]